MGVWSIFNSFLRRLHLLDNVHDGAWSRTLRND
jgi:hypothetical protein